MFNINEFNSQINKRGLAVNNLFVVRITPPQKLTALGENYNMGSDLVFFCRTVDIPSLDIGTTPVKEQGYGIGTQRPTGIDYSPLTGVFMIDSNFLIKKFFHRWSQMVFNYNVSGGMLSSDPQSNRATNAQQGVYQFGYKEDYVGTLEVIVYSQHIDQPAYKYEYKFNNVFPTSIGAQQLAWENGAEILTLPVTFSYDEFTPSGSIGGTVTQDFNRGNGLFNYLSALNTYGQAIKQISRPHSLQDLVNTITDVRTIFNSF